MKIRYPGVTKEAFTRPLTSALDYTQGLVVRYLLEEGANGSAATGESDEEEEWFDAFGGGGADYR